jgi:hypothetical protein
MKKVFVFLFLISSLLNAQESIEDINKLENSKKLILAEIHLLNDSLKKIDLRI